jgi:hypothetical protein
MSTFGGGFFIIAVLLIGISIGICLGGWMQRREDRES